MPGFKYRLFLVDGTDVGEAEYAFMVKPGEVVHLNGATRVRVLDVVPIEEEDESPFTGFLSIAIDDGG